VTAERPLEPVIDALYALPLEEFTPARDAVTKRLRARGEREAAERVKACRKPSVTAWALNRARRREQSHVTELLDAGQRLREAQQRLIEAGDRDQLHEASAHQRRLVEAVVEDAEAELVAAGHSVGPAVRNRLFATLHAAAADDEARSLLAAGRLVHDYQVADLGLGFEPAATPAAKPPRPPRPDARRLDSARQQLERATAELLRARAELISAEEQLQSAEVELRRAEEHAVRARAAVATADQHVAELEASLEGLA
jgi:hypothetical protein